MSLLLKKPRKTPRHKAETAPREAAPRESDQAVVSTLDAPDAMVPDELTPPVPGALYIERLSHEGRGVAHDEHGKTCFVEGALPGEWVIATTQKTRQRYNDTSASEIIVASNQRVAPICAHFERCGGCRLQHLDHGAEVLFKQSRVHEQLLHIGQLSHLPEPESPLCGASQGYRRKARLGVKWRRDGRLILGFRAAQSAQLVDVQQCPIIETRLNALLPSLRSLLTSLESRHVGHLELIAGDHALAVSIRWLRDRARLPEADRQRWLAWASTHDVVVWLQDDHGFIPLSCQASLQYEISAAMTQEHGQGSHPPKPPSVSLFFEPEDFLQVNAGINQRMIHQALTWLNLSTNDTVLDLFCGFGNFSFPMACHSGRVIGIEGVAAQVERAQSNAANLPACTGEVEFVTADLNQPLNWSRLGLANGVDCVVLDPPRAGAEVQVQQVTQLNPRQILYISCDAATLARDAGLLARQGYTLVRWGVMDMFPRTAHVETMALFQQ